jgi:hypothetical protein|tara:strand:- start:234 stop:620 length:387 start_codon:yes stop_codon:yes gene_type:complete
MPRSIILEFPFLPPPELRGNTRAHWAAIANKKQDIKDAVWGRLDRIGHVWKMPAAALEVTAYWCGKPIDRDNFTYGLKAYIDAIVEYGILEDDSPEYIRGIVVDYVRVKHRDEVRMVLEIQEAPDGTE